MGKKFSENEIFIKKLLDTGTKPVEIIKKYQKISKQINLTYKQTKIIGKK